MVKKKEVKEEVVEEVVEVFDGSAVVESNFDVDPNDPRTRSDR